MLKGLRPSIASGSSSWPRLTGFPDVEGIETVVFRRPLPSTRLTGFPDVEGIETAATRRPGRWCLTGFPDVEGIETRLS